MEGCSTSQHVFRLKQTPSWNSSYRELDLKRHHPAVTGGYPLTYELNTTPL